jgi:hypothetical protein
MTWLEWFELLSYVVTIIGFPLAILVSIFERAYILVYEDKMNKHTQRLWSSWEDYMREWCRREDFKAVLPKLLEGEDEDFQRHIQKVALQAR